MTQEEGATVLAILVKRRGCPSQVTLESGEVLEVRTIAWGRDLGAE